MSRDPATDEPDVNVSDRDAPDTGAGGPGAGGRTTLFLCGDVMTGRGVDQVLPASVDPALHEPFVKDARRYLELARAESGEIPDRVEAPYVWGDALGELARVDPDVRLANLETAVTDRGDPWPRKGIHYRMHPGNVPVLRAAGLDACSLGNNHAMDWGRDGLRDTLAALREAGIGVAGAGEDREQARAPAVCPGEGGRVLVFGLASPTAGVPREWAAGPDRSGVALLPEISRSSADRLADRILDRRGPGDRVVVSVHWGSNWGYRVPDAQRAFARRLAERGAADVVHGHSSHHPKGLEIHRGRLLLYGCGDFLNDYEGISGHEEFRPDLTLMYFPVLDSAGGHLRSLHMTPMRIRRFRLERASREDARWLRDRLARESRTPAAGIRLDDDARLVVER